MAFKAPSGLMASPDNLEACVAFPLEEPEGHAYGTLYISHEVWEARDPAAGEMLFYIQDYGRFRLRIHG